MTGHSGRNRERQHLDGATAGHGRPGQQSARPRSHHRRRPGPARPGLRTAPGRTGEAHLDRPVRWVHITELTDPASFLKGGELVLTTGMPLPEEPAGIRRYVDELAGIGAAALVIELVRRYHRPPEVLVHACRARGLPLITLAKDVNFLEVTQVVHALVLGNQAEAMRRTQRVHEAFTKLTLRGAGPEDVMRAAAEMSGRTVVLENLVHQALICEPSGTTLEEALTDWEQRSRATPPGDRTSQRGPEGWLTAPVEYQGERWGRVAMLPAPTAEPAFGPEHVTVLERTAMALTVARLIHPTPWERTAHRNALRDLVEQRHRSPEDAYARLAALGLPTENSRFLTVVVDLPAEDTTANPETRLSQDLHTTGIPTLIGKLTPGRLGVQLALSPSHPWHHGRTAEPRRARPLPAGRRERRLRGRRPHRRPPFLPPGNPRGRGHPARPAPPPGRSFHELSDVGLRRLLYALREDTRIQQYAEQQLGRLLYHDTRHGTDLLTTLRHYLDAAGNKTSAARRGGLSRETFYQRMRTIERLLDCDLESGEQRTALQVALTALDVLRVR